MTAWLAANLAPVMFFAMILFLLSGAPVAFALATCGIVFGLIGIELGLLSASLVQAMPDRVFGVMSNETLLAVPFFTFMGIVLERSGMAEDLLDTIGQIFGSVRGGLAYAVVVVGALLAATTGVVAASVIAMGLISLPIMLRYGYAARLATGTIAASGALVADRAALARPHRHGRPARPAGRRHVSRRDRPGPDPDRRSTASTSSW
jgi:TRAP-type mannitol/chloroaromatic compound transport system permease large subunit